MIVLQSAAWFRALPLTSDEPERSQNCWPLARPHTIKLFLLSLYGLSRSREIAYQALPLLLRVTLRTWDGPGDEAKMLPRRLTKASEQRGRMFSASASARSGGHPVFCRHIYAIWTVSLVSTWYRLVYGIFYGHFYGKVDTCACSRYQAFPLLPPPTNQKAWGQG